MRVFSLHVVCVWFAYDLCTVCVWFVYGLFCHLTGPTLK